MDLGLSGKVAIVSGGSKGIGRAAADGFLREGASVLICARGRAALDEAISAAGALARGRIAALVADLTDPAAAQKVIDHALSAFGRLDILVNNAGSVRPGKFQEIPDEQWKFDMELKFFGYMRMARAAMAKMAERRSGVIINVIGGAALRPQAENMVAGASNVALNHFTKALAQEGAKFGVRAVGINPGPVLTERLKFLLQERARLAASSQPMEETLKAMTPMGRVGKPEEIGDVIVFMASDRASFVTGTNLSVDGGANPGLMG